MYISCWEFSIEIICWFFKFALSRTGSALRRAFESSFFFAFWAFGWFKNFPERTWFSICSLIWSNFKVFLLSVKAFDVKTNPDWLLSKVFFFGFGLLLIGTKIIKIMLFSIELNS
jgi:hypothetical protein